MALPAGTRFGSYEIVEQIGVGGMGEVYRATDTNLKRAVAVKVLPASFAGDADRVARLQREAEALAALNHLNIAHIYGLERNGDAAALVMELIEGPTLEARIADGPVPVDEALAIAIQVADAIEAAHEQGIVHRDLKPANIKLRPDGIVKVLDFGIAKNVEGPMAASGSGTPALTTPAMTETGMILGTASYMSPEQARGKPLDKRTDVWAFGAVLYEMLTGQPPFLGEDVTETIAAVLKSEPDWQALPALPPLVLVLLKQCLRKNPADRIHHIADVRLALADKYDVSPLALANASPAGNAKRISNVGLVALVIAGIGVAVGGFFYWNTAASPAGTDITIRQITFRHGDIGIARFASDGEVIVYGAAWDDEPYRMYTTRLGSYQARPLDLPPADLLAVSGENELALAMDRKPADGWLPRDEMGIVGLAGGAPRVVDDDVVAVEWGSARELAALVRRGDGESLLEFPVGTVIHRSSMISPPRLSPDGTRICVPTNYGNLMVAEPGSAPALVADGLSRIGECAWSPDGSEIWVTYSPTLSTHTNLEAFSVDGEGHRVLAALPSFARLHDVSPTGGALITAGELVYSAYGASSIGSRERNLSIFDASRVVGIDATGTNILVFENSTGSFINRARLWLKPMDGSPAVRLTNALPLGLTNDGQWIAVLGDGGDQAFAPFESAQITLMPIGAGGPRTTELPITVQYRPGNQLGINEWDTKFPDLSSDSRRLLIPFGQNADGVVRAWVHDFGEGWTRAVTPAGVTGPLVLSPDGEFVASNEPDGLFVYSVDTGERREVAGGSDPGILAQWGTDGEFLYLLEYAGPSATVVRRSAQTGEREIIGEIRVPDPAGVTRFDVWIARNGEAYAYTLDRRLENLFLLENLN